MANRFQPEPSFYVGESRHGLGLFARRPIARGETILVFSGPLIRFADTAAKGEREADPLQIGDDLYLDLEEPARLVNHSCQPNAGVVDDLFLVALTDIGPGEEVAFDYSTTMGDGHWTMTCECGTRRCRGVVRDLDEVAGELQEQYLEQEIVQSYLLPRLGVLPAQRAGGRRR